MQARDFCFWLQGYFEIQGGDALTAERVAVIRQHLGLVFQHDASIGAPAHPEITWPPKQGGFNVESFRNDSLMVC